MAENNHHYHDVVKQIATAHEALTKTQQKVVQFLLNEGLEALYLSSSQISDALNINRSTVVRTAQALGYQGFADLQTALQEHFAAHFSSRDWFDIGSRRLIEEFDETGSSEKHSVLLHMVQIETQKLVALPDLIPGEDFERAVDLLLAARRIQIIGLYLSHSLALNLFYPLRFMGLDCVLLQPESVEFERHLAGISEGDVLFAISNARYARATLQSIEIAKDSGAAIVTLTDSLLSPAAGRSDVAFVIPAKLWFYSNSVVPFTLLNALSAALLLRLDNKSTDELPRVKRVFQQFQTFLTDER